MKKMAFIIDKPKYCDTCPIHGADVCRKLSVKDSKGPKGCPLVRIPDQKRVYPDAEARIGENRINIANAGWNACLAEMVRSTSDPTAKEVIAAAETQDNEQMAYDEAVLRIAQDHSMDAMDFTMLKELSMANILIGDLIHVSNRDSDVGEYDYDSEQPTELVKAREAVVKQMAKLKILIDAYVLMNGAADGEMESYVKKLMENKGEEIEKSIIPL